MRFKGFFLPGLAMMLNFMIPLGAQAQEFDSLSFIHSHLQEENIQVIDFSLPENQWGNLTPEWIERLKEQGVERLDELAKTYEPDFEKWHEDQYQKALLDAQQTQAGTQAQRQETEDEIALLEEDLQVLEKEMKDELASLFSSLPEIEQEQGANLLFNELAYYFSTVRWGGIPYSIARALKEEETLWSGPSRSLIVLAQDYLPLGREEGLQALQEKLEGLSYLDASGEELSLSAPEVELIFQAMVATEFEGERQLNEVVQSVVRGVRNLLGALAVLFILIAGLRMVFAQGNEETITEQKRAILYALLGLIILLLLERMIALIYGAPGEFQMNLRENREFDAEIYGLISFIRAVIGIVAVAVLVRSGIQAITSQGEEDEIKKQRQSVIWVGVGLVVIAINRVIVENIFIAPTQQDDQIYSSNIAKIIETLGTVLKFLLAFTGLIALAILVYGAGMMIFNYGDEELVNKSKTMIKNAVIGMLVILAAFALVATLVSFG